MRDALHIPLYIAGEPVSLLKVNVCKRREVTLRKNGQGKQGQCHESLYNKRTTSKQVKQPNYGRLLSNHYFHLSNNSNNVKREEKKKHKFKITLTFSMCNIEKTKRTK